MNAGESFASPSRVASGRRSSSRSRTSLPVTGSATGTSDPAKRRSSAARAARCCDRSANSSTSSRERTSSVAMRSALIPCGTWKKRSRRRMLPPSSPAPSEPMGARDMLSTPPATTRSSAPEAAPIAAKLTACRPEPQNRLRVVALTSIGQPALSTALRARFAPCSSTCETQPAITSSTRAGSKPLRRASATSSCANNSCGWVPESAPLPAFPRPRGVRTASIT